MTKPLDLNLTDEEKQTIEDRVNLRSRDPEDFLRAYADDLADAGVAKAAWVIVEWLTEHANEIYDHVDSPDIMLAEALESQGIQKPE